MKDAGRHLPQRTGEHHSRLITMRTLTLAFTIACFAATTGYTQDDKKAAIADKEAKEAEEVASLVEKFDKIHKEMIEASARENRIRSKELIPERIKAASALKGKNIALTLTYKSNSIKNITVAKNAKTAVAVMNHELRYNKSKIPFLLTLASEDAMTRAIYKDAKKDDQFLVHGKIIAVVPKSQTKAFNAASGGGSSNSEYVCIVNVIKYEKIK